MQGIETLVQGNVLIEGNVMLQGQGAGQGAWQGNTAGHNLVFFPSVLGTRMN